VRCIYLKYDTVDNVHLKLGNLLKNQILPIIKHKKVPKPIFLDEEHLMEKIDELLIQYEELFEAMITAVLRSRPAMVNPKDRHYVTIQDLVKFFGVDFGEGKESFVL
jgi:hypothetical protein